MRHHLLAVILRPLFIALLAQVTPSAATPQVHGFGFGRNGNDRTQIAHGHSRFFTPPGSTLGSPDTIARAPESTSTPDAQPVSTPSPTSTIQPQNANVVQQSTGTTSTAAASSLSKSGVIAKPSNSTVANTPSDSAPTALSPPSPIASDSTSTSPPPATAASASPTRAHLLVEILLPVLFAALLAGGSIFVLCRRRSVRDKKEWEGSHLPDLEPPSAGFTLFGGRARAASEARRADTVYAGSAWSRSDAHLRSSVDISGCDEKGDAASVAESLEQGHAQGPETEVEHPDFIIVGAPAFHSESPLQEQDEPALADSRPNTLMAPLSQDITHAL